MIKPDIGILTSIGNQHLDLFGSKEKLIAAKKELLESLSEEDRAYINIDIGEYEQLISGLKCKIITFSATKKADIYVEDLTTSCFSSSATVRYGHHILPLTLKIPGAHNISNLLPCVGVAIDLNINDDEIIKTVSQLKGVGKRLELKDGIKGAKVLDDSYNSNVDGFISALKTIETCSNKKKIIISKGIIELGNEKEKAYSKICSNIKPDMQMFTTDSDFIKSGNKNIILYPNERAILNHLFKILDQDSLLLIEGKFTGNFIDSLIK